MAVFKVKKGDTYESIGRRTGASAGAVMRYFKGRPIYAGMKYNDEKLRGMVQGGQAYAALSPDINPWGMPEGEVPDWAWETEAGTDIAQNYLDAIGISGAGGAGITAGGAGVAEEPTTLGVGAEKKRAAAREDRAVRDGGGALPATPELGEPISLESLAAGAIGPAAPAVTPTAAGRRRTGAVPYEAAGIPRTDVSAMAYAEAYEKAANWAMGTMLPEGYDATARSTQTLGEPISLDTLAGGEIGPTAPGRERAGMHTRPSHYGMRGTGMAATEVLQAVNEGEAPTSISLEVQDYLGYSDELMESALYVFNSETGVWELDMSGEEGGEGEVAGGGGYPGGYGGYGRGRRRGGGWRGGRRQPYSSTLYNGRVNTQFNWRIGWR